MNKLELKELAEERYLDIVDSELDLDIEQQQELAKNQGLSLDDFQLAIMDKLEDEKFNEEAETMTGREFIEREPLEKRYAAACFCARVYTRDSSPEEVLKLSGYSDKEIEEIIQADENNQIPA